MKRRGLPRSATLPNVKRRRVKYETYKKWVMEFDKKYQTMTWLDCETETEAGTKVVTNLKCGLCSKYRDGIVGRKNFSDKWITGADSVRTTNVRDHAKSDQHAHVINLHRRELARSKGLSATAYAPIAQALSTLPEDEKKSLGGSLILPILWHLNNFHSRNIPDFVSWRLAMELTWVVPT